MKFLAAGYPMKDVEKDMLMTESTLKRSVRKLVSKLGAGSKIEAVAIAAKRGWI